MPTPKQEKTDVNARQELFCRLYSTDKEFFGNGVECYTEAYDVDQRKPNWYMVAAAGASRLLKNVKIIARINEILNETGFNDVAIDKQLSFLVHQHADFNAKLGAIKEYNKLKQRIVERADLTSGGRPLISIDQAIAKKYAITPSTSSDSNRSA